MLDKVGGRKAAACLTGLIAVVGCFLYTGSVNSDLVDAIKFLVTAYIAGNVGADTVAAVQAKLETAPAAPQVDFSGVEGKLDALIASQGTTNQGVTYIVQKINSAS